MPKTSLYLGLFITRYNKIVKHNSEKEALFYLQKMQCALFMKIHQKEILLKEKMS